MTYYIALLRKDAMSNYAVRFPDFPDCLISGATIEEAVKNAERSLAAHAAQLRSRGKPIKGPSNLDCIREDAQERQYFHQALIIMIRLNGCGPDNG